MSRRSERIAHDQECNLITDGCVQDCVHALRKREFNDSRTESLQGVEQGLKHLFNALAIRDFDRLSVERALPADEWTIYNIHVRHRTLEILLRTSFSASTLKIEV